MHKITKGAPVIVKAHHGFYAGLSGTVGELYKSGGRWVAVVLRDDASGVLQMPLAALALVVAQ